MSAPPSDASASKPTAGDASVSASDLNRHARDALDELSFLSPLYQHGALALLVKVLSAVVASPGDARYRRVNAMKLLPKLRSKAGLKLLEALGFKHQATKTEDQADKEEEFMTMQAPDDKATKQIESALERLQALLAASDAGQMINTALAEAAPSAAAPSASSSSSALSSSPFAALFVPLPSAPLPFQPQQPQEGELIEDDRFVFFWHAPTWSAQWTMVPFVMDGVVYVGPEQWMMASKARLFGDHATFARIMTSASAREHKKLGREVRNFDAQVWEAAMVDIVTKGNFAKFSQHPAFARRLLATKEKLLVEASPLDSIWGVGMAASHKDIRSPEKWLGTNFLGKALMNVRTMLREQQAQEGIFD